MTAPRLVLPRRRVVTVRSVQRSADVVSRGIAVGGLCCLLGLSACGVRSSSRASDVTTTSAAVSTAGTGTAGTVTASSVASTATGTSPAPGAASAEQTQPTITPSLGRPHTTFAVRLTARTRLGAHGVVNTVYRVAATGPTEPGCEREAAATINRGKAGQRLQVVFRPGSAGSCPGEWHGVVLLEQGPNCVKGRPCPEFASRVVEVGQLAWRVS